MLCIWQLSHFCFAMKSLVHILACLTVTYAQGIAIYSPSTGDTLSPGQDTVVQIATPVCMHTKLETQISSSACCRISYHLRKKFQLLLALILVPQALVCPQARYWGVRSTLARITPTMILTSLFCNHIRTSRSLSLLLYPKGEQTLVSHTSLLLGYILSNCILI